ncbi:MAG: phosphate ABC transporter permease subunit PstC [Candidatus Bathyarchaeota archaeon]|nr:phosphate ABC transporter permease subunit PstC [Candidatus Bathyarchaeota archaeon]MCX8176690.1 phosphate ABC transporter permease subunit PstC [Candidatus Bathyarchaeota archaeon]MDW8193218.1 phosphate ABC transporter permease subunit PstC [Nitrososphaerota archaeon]
MKSFDKPVEKLMFLCALSSIVFLFLMLLFITREGMQALFTFGADFIIGPVWETNSNLYGALPLIYGSLMVVAVALAVAVPIGVATAMFVEEVLPFSIRDLVKSLIELLASIPSIIYGFIGVLFLAPQIASLFGLSSGTVALTASLVLAIMTIPTIVSVSGETIAAVPKEYKEAALALGATKWQTLKNVVVPTAKSGILASVMLGFGRAIGETVAVLMVAGNVAVIPTPPWNILSPVYTLTAAIAMQMGEAAVGTLEYSALFGLGLILFIITLVVNSLADIIAKKGIKGEKGL